MNDYDENTTICGYNLKELILFAETCRKCNVSEEDLHMFATGASVFIEKIINIMNEDFIKHITDAIDRIGKIT